MKCECGAISTILVEDADGNVTPKCEQCYYNPKFSSDEISKGLKNLERRLQQTHTPDAEQPEDEFDFSHSDECNCFVCRKRR